MSGSVRWGGGTWKAALAPGSSTRAILRSPCLCGRRARCWQLGLRCFATGKSWHYRHIEPPVAHTSQVQAYCVAARHGLATPRDFGQVVEERAARRFVNMREPKLSRDRLRAGGASRRSVVRMENKERRATCQICSPISAASSRLRRRHYLYLSVPSRGSCDPAVDGGTR